jgi:tripartite-type tricarboxylate transporter receptor subunit TctC
MSRRFSFLLLFLVGVGAAAQTPTDWPTKPVRVVVNSTPGGGTDVAGRLIAQALSEATGQQFFVDNKPGAGGTIGAQLVATAPPDGNTLLVSANAAVAINQWLIKSPGFDVAQDLSPVSRGVMALAVLVVNPSLKVNNLAEFIALAKDKPGELAFGSSGVGTPLHLGVRMIEGIADVQFLHIPYQGNAQAYQDMVAGRIHFMYTDAASALPFITSGKLKALAVSQKTPLLPSVPTFAEAGLPTFEAPISFSVFTPAKTPNSMILRMSAEVGRAMRAIAPQLEGRGLLPVYDTPSEFAKALDRERAEWGGVIKRNHITTEQ